MPELRKVSKVSGHYLATLLCKGYVIQGQILRPTCRAECTSSSSTC
jgi:hypothetical protein